jgi:hypothetical protein
MSFKAKIATGAATVAVAGGSLVTFGAMNASAATPPCGNKCIELYTEKYGQTYQLDSFGAASATGNPIILFQASNSDRALDFSYSIEGTVKQIAKKNKKLVTPGLVLRYGNDPALELEYSPWGVNSNQCAGTWPGKVANGYKVRLEPCGQSASTLWVFDQAKLRKGYAPLIAGAQSNYSNPYVMTEPGDGPASVPRPWVQVQNLNTYSNGVVFDNQMWSARLGPET